MAKTEIKITIKIGELFYDIATKTYLANRTAMSGDKYEEAADATTDSSEECENELYRSIQSAIAKLRTHLGKYIYNYEEVEEINNSLKNDVKRSIDKGYVFVFSMPYNFSVSSIDFISAGLHDYIVNYAIGNWYLKTNADEANAYYKMAEGLLPQIYGAMSKRTRHRRGTRF